MEICTFACDLPFHTQIASRDCLMQLNNLLFLKDLPNDVKKKNYKY